MNALNHRLDEDQSNDFWGADYQDENPLLIQHGRFDTLADLLESVNKGFREDFEQMSSELLAFDN